MVPNIELKVLSNMLDTAGIVGFNGSYQLLGGGEVNYTYKLDCEDSPTILRIAKDEGQKTLMNEARALSLLDSVFIPKLLFFDDSKLINNRMWILESYLSGKSEQRLTIEQFGKFGSLLAQVHKVPSPNTKINLREQFLDSCKAFGDEHMLLSHPNGVLRQLIHDAFEEFKRLQPSYNSISSALIHSDATPSNILVNGNQVGLIDWEFSKFSDPMCDFSTIYYEDIEYNQSKWRIHIRPDEKQALFSGYRNGGGAIDEARIKFWIRFDKLGAAVFLYWRIKESTRETSQSQTNQYQKDFDAIINSLIT